MIKLLDLIRKHNYDCVKFYLVDDKTGEILAVNLKDDMCPYVNCIVTRISYMQDEIEIYVKKEIKIKHMKCEDMPCEKCVLDFMNCFDLDHDSEDTIGEIAEKFFETNPKNKNAKLIKDLIDAKLEEFYE